MPKGVFTCDICGHAFSRNSNLTRHKRKHSGEKRFPCLKCNYRGAEKHHLIAHQRTHTRERPFTCHRCILSFADRSNYVRHCKTKRHQALLPTLEAAHALARLPAVYSPPTPIPARVLVLKPLPVEYTSPMLTAQYILGLLAKDVKTVSRANDHSSRLPPT